MGNRRPWARKPRTRVDLSSSAASADTAAAAAKLPAAAGASAELAPQRSLSPKSVVFKAGTATLDPSSANASEAGDAGAAVFMPAATAPAAAGSPQDRCSLHAQLAELALAAPDASPGPSQPIPIFGGAELAACLDPHATASFWDPSFDATWADPAALAWAAGMDVRDAALWVRAALRRAPGRPPQPALPRCLGLLPRINQLAEA